MPHIYPRIALISLEMPLPPLILLPPVHLLLSTPHFPFTGFEAQTFWNMVVRMRNFGTDSFSATEFPHWKHFSFQLERCSPSAFWLLGRGVSQLLYLAILCSWGDFFPVYSWNHSFAQGSNQCGICNETDRLVEGYW